VKASGLAAPLQVLGRVLRNADVRRLELAWAASNLASRASAIAVAVYAYESGGVTAVGVVAFIRLAAAAAAAPWLSLLADRRPRRVVMIGSDLVRGVMLAAMAALVQFAAARPAVYALAVLVALPEPLFRSAQVAHTPSLVATPEDLIAANVVASGVESIGLFVGPALGGLLLAVSGVETAFAVTAALVLVSAAFVARIQIEGAPREEEGQPRGQALLAGWRVILGQPGLRVVIGLFSAQTLVAGLFNVLVVVLAVEVLGLDVSGVGWLDGIVGIGAAAGVLVVAGLARRRLVPQFAAGLLLWGVPLALIAARPELGLAVVLLFLVGIGNTLVDVTGVTLMQRAAPDAVLGRVFGAFEALVLFAMAVGSLLAPLLVAAFGTRAALAVAGAILPVVLLPLWRTLASLEALPAPPADHVALLDAVPMFAPLAPPQLERLAQALVEMRVAAGEPVVAEGELGERFYLIVDGNAAVSVGGREVGTLGPGAYFGEIALLRDVPRTATVRARTALRLLALEGDTFLGTVNGNAASGEAARSIVAARLPSPVIG
jgi:MFS family permease